jgi:hypothetical protein
MSLPSTWIDSLFARLTVRYGVAFMRQYECLDMDAVKADWADVLGGFKDHPDALRHGLDSLDPDRPPTAMQFRKLCNAAPRDDKVLSLPAPVADPERVAAVKRKLAELRAKLVSV